MDRHCYCYTATATLIMIHCYTLCIHVTHYTVTCRVHHHTVYHVHDADQPSMRTRCFTAGSAWSQLAEPIPHSMRYAPSEQTIDAHTMADPMLRSMRCARKTQSRFCAPSVVHQANEPSMRMRWLTRRFTACTITEPIPRTRLTNHANKPSMRTR